MHMMIDLETLSTAPNAVVTQLGWCLFDPETGATESGCYHLSVEPQIQNGCIMDWETIAWWMKQEEEARMLMAQRARFGYLEALEGLSAIYSAYKVEAVWSHGATFDIVILENLFRTVYMSPPWKYNAVRDTRTLFWLAGPELEYGKNEVKHSAEHDAAAQARTVMNAIKMLKGKTPCMSST